MSARWWCLVLFCCFLGACETPIWRGQTNPKDRCDPALESRLKDTIFWQNTFGKEGYERARACLRVSWGEDDAQGVGVVVEVSADGFVYGWNDATNRYDGDVDVVFPAEARGLVKGFWLFVFGSAFQSGEQQEQLCGADMSQPGYRCDDSPASTCVFSWLFQPVARGGEVAKDVPGEGLSCRLVLRSFVSEEATPDVGP